MRRRNSAMHPLKSISYRTFGSPDEQYDYCGLRSSLPLGESLVNCQVPGSIHAQGLNSARMILLSNAW